MKQLIQGLFLWALLSSACFAGELQVSVSSGWPFIVTPTIAMEHNSIEYYVNYKIGLDDGFSLGLEKQFDNNVFGMFIGAVGAKGAQYDCEKNLTCGLLRIAITDKKTTQGVGLSYEYRFSEGREGWGLRLEGGYGKESRNDSSRFDGNLQVVYHF